CGGPQSDPQHSIIVVFLLVLVFFIMGLVGFLICHVLKKKGYRCRTFRDELDPDDKEGVEELEDDEEKNDDTVEKIVKCIIQNQANVEALKEMLGETEGDVAVPVPSLCPHSSSQDGGPPHHHTVHLGSTQAPCIHCSKRKRHPLQRQGRSKEGKSRMHPGETTVFSVGRYANELCQTFPCCNEHHGLFPSPPVPPPLAPGQAPSSRVGMESWNGLGQKGPQSSSCSTPCHGQGHLPLSQVAPSPNVQPGLGHCQGSRGSPSCSGHPVPGPAHPPREQFLPKIPSIPALWHWEAIPCVLSCGFFHRQGQEPQQGGELGLYGVLEEQGVQITSCGHCQLLVPSVPVAVLGGGAR
uniref:Uncharacterized protein n=1 Tax=Corvus moneduloides TaxID=1196302 RepID=A0A8C3EDE0_CORMO